MLCDRTDEFEHGTRLLARLPEVVAGEDDDLIRPIYAHLRATLRVPFVDALFRVLANYPAYLRFASGQFGPYVRTPVFEHAADDLRARFSLACTQRATP